MAHIFFEKLENRRSTQSLSGVYSIPDNTPRLLYAAPTNQVATYYGVMQPSASSYNPYPSTGIFPWSGWGYGYGYGYGNGYGNAYGYGYNPYGFGGYTPFNSFSPWNNPFSPYSSPWANPFSNLWSGVSNIVSPLWNVLGGFFGLQTSPWSPYPFYPRTSPNPVIPSGQITAIYAAPISSSAAYYGISLPTPSTSYSPPGSTVWALYGVSLPTSSSSSSY